MLYANPESVNGERNVQLSIDFTAYRPQRFWFGMVGRVVDVRFMGECEVCGRRTYAFDGADGDPRGPLGLHLNDNLEAVEFGKAGPDVVCCWNCHSNDSKRYEAARAISRERWV